MSYSRKEFKREVDLCVARCGLSFFFFKVYEANGNPGMDGAIANLVDVNQQVDRLECLQFVEVQGIWSIKEAADDALFYITKQARTMALAVISRFQAFPDRYLGRQSRKIESVEVDAWIDEFRILIMSVIRSYVIDRANDGHYQSDLDSGEASVSEISAANAQRGMVNAENGADVCT